MKRFYVLFLLLFLFVAVTPIMAQDTTPASPLEVPSFEEVRDTFALALLTLLSGIIASPVTSAIVAFVKRLPPLKNTPAAAINVVVAVVLMGGSWAATYFGFKIEFDKLLELIIAIAPILLGVEINAAGSRGWYHSPIMKDMPFFGTSRKPA